MSSFDLKPVTDEIILEMGFSPRDLWFVKIQDTTYGPFETESLKHYSAENSHHFDEALVKLSNASEWIPFYSAQQFQRRQSEVDNHSSEGPFWLLVEGQKVGPYSVHDLAHKLEHHEIARTDLFSADDGHSWHKVYQIPAFDRRNMKSTPLPHIPNETSFQKAKIDVVENMESHQGPSQQDRLAQLAYLGQKKNKHVVLNLDEITLKGIQETDVSKSLKWAIPAFSACVIVMALTAWYFISPKKQTTLVEVTEESFRPSITPKTTQTNPVETPTPAPRQNLPQRIDPVRRMPASVQPMPTPSMPRRMERPFNPRLPVTHESEFPTHIETHDNDRSPSNDESYKEKDIDPIDQDREPVETKEDKNVVDTGDDNRSLDQEMNREPASHDPSVDSPVVEEPVDY